MTRLELIAYIMHYGHQQAGPLIHQSDEDLLALASALYRVMTFQHADPAFPLPTSELGSPNT